MTLSNRQKMALVISLAIFFVALDRLGKILALRFWTEQPLALASYFKLDFYLNRQLAFSLPLTAWPVILLTTILLVVLLVWTIKLIKKNRLEKAGWAAAVWLAAASNLFDRLFYGGVIDYLNLKYFTVFNLADAIICLGLAGLALKKLRS